MRNNLYSDEGRIGYIEGSAFYDQYDKKVCNFEDGDFYDPITREVFYRVNKDGSITAGTSNEVVGKLYEDGSITLHGSWGICGKFDNELDLDSNSNTSYGNVGGKSFLVEILGIIGLIGAGFLIWFVILNSMFDSQKDTVFSGSILFYHLATTGFLLYCIINSLKKQKLLPESIYNLPMLAHIISYPFVGIICILLDGGISTILGLIFICFLLGIVPMLIQIGSLKVYDRIKSKKFNSLI